MKKIKEKRKMNRVNAYKAEKFTESNYDMNFMPYWYFNK